jgi:L-fucose isomerase-like protein
MQLAKSQHYAALTLRCWPEFQVDYGASACLPLAMLSDSGVITSDEGDMGGLISMLAQYYATDKAHVPTLLDLIGFEGDKNTCWLWHCGASPASLKRHGSTPKIFDSPILSPEPGGTSGPALETSFQPGAVTVLRLSGDDCSRYLSFSGEVLAVPTRFHGAYAEVQLASDQSVVDVVNTALTSGCEYHFSFAYSDHEAVVREAAYWLGIEPFQRVPHDCGAGAFSSKLLAKE